MPGRQRGRWVIAATVLGSAMASIDATVVGIALPTIGREFHASLGTLQWVVTGYSLTLASLLLLGGSLGDNFGRRRVFMVGVIWFVLSSAACALAPGTTVLIGTRVLQGVGAALLTPGSLAILQASFDPDDRGRAIGSWSGLGGVATAAGPSLGGYLIAAASWRLIFLVNLPIGAFVLLISARHVPESRDPGATGHVDIVGALLATLALGGVTFALIEGPSLGWAAPSVAGPCCPSASCPGSPSSWWRGSRRRRCSRSPSFGSVSSPSPTRSPSSSTPLWVERSSSCRLQLQVVDHYSPARVGR